MVTNLELSAFCRGFALETGPGHLFTEATDSYTCFCTVPCRTFDSRVYIELLISLLQPKLPKPCLHGPC